MFVTNGLHVSGREDYRRRKRDFGPPRLQVGQSACPLVACTWREASGAAKCLRRRYAWVSAAALSNTLFRKKPQLGPGQRPTSPRQTTNGFDLKGEP